MKKWVVYYNFVEYGEPDEDGNRYRDYAALYLEADTELLAQTTFEARFPKNRDYRVRRII